MTAIGALFGLLISVFLIIKKISPTYSLDYWVDCHWQIP